MTRKMIAVAISALLMAGCTVNSKSSLYFEEPQLAESIVNLKEDKGALATPVKSRQGVPVWLTLSLLAMMFILLMLVVIQASLILRKRSRIQQMEQEAQKARDRFFTNITHEFRTPLTVIHIASKQLRQIVEKLDVAERDEMLRHISSIDYHGGSLLSLINQLLDMARLKAVPDNCDCWRSGDVVAFIRMIVSSYQSYADQKQLTLRYQAQPEHLTTDFIPDLMTKILRNLVANAIKFAYPKTEILVSVCQENDKMVLTVKDHGVGMTEDVLKHIFKPFYQGEEDTKNIGTGVGLSLVKLAVNAMGGTISVSSTKGQGSEFVIVLDIKHGTKVWQPLTAEATDELPLTDYLLATSGPNQKERDGNGNQNGDEDGDNEDTVRVLVVEDSAELGKYIGDSLPNNCTIYYAENGQEGIEKAHSIVPDMIITDVMMPEMDGYELCREIRNSALLSHIPIIMVTAKTIPEDKMKGLACGVDAYLEKPFEPEILRLHVENLMAQRRLLRKKFILGTEGAAINVKTIPTVLEPSERNREFLLKLDGFIATQMNENKMDLGELASKLCVTRVQLNRKVKAITGVSTSAYVAQVKLQMAKKLLIEQPDMTIGEVSLACGVLDVAYFSRRFKLETGFTPSQYRKLSLES